MSVFDDFQRMWMQKFPHFTLSDKWEQDVKASLSRHREKIIDLTKELEQETQYCEYLERLLEDVEKFRQNGGGGGDGASTSPSSSNNVMSSSGNLDALLSPEHLLKTKKDLTHPTDTSSTTNATTPSHNDEKSENDTDVENTEKQNELIHLRNNGALNQCINELSTNLRRCVSEIPAEVNTDSASKERNSFGNNTNITRSRSNSLSEPRSKSPSHFITVIELKEEDATRSSSPQSTATLTATVTTTSTPSNTTTTTTSSSFSSISTTQHTTTHSVAAISPVRTSGSKVADLKRNIESQSDSSVSEDVPRASDLLASIHEQKKKIPPRPPPKIATRRVEPPVVPPTAAARKKDGTPDSSLERNVKPSDIFRQKSNESLESRSSNSSKMIENTAKAKPSELVEEFERRLHKSESLEKTKGKNTESPTGSLGKMSTENSSNRNYRSYATGGGSLDKAVFKGSDNLKTTDSRESLISNGANSDKIKSYESASSVESLRNIEEPYVDREPYYDTVPIEDEGLHLPSRIYKTSTSQVDPESPGHHSNYVNINYFLEHNNEERLLDSDNEDGSTPMLMRHISRDEYPTTPDQFRKNSSNSDTRNIRHMISSIITSERLYVECLNKMVKYMKAINATLTTSQPVITKDEYQTIFFKIEELYNVHNDFLNQLTQKTSLDGGDMLVGDVFKQLVDHIHLYGAYLHNYGRAIDTVKKCGEHSDQFKQIVSNIVLNSQNGQSLSLDDLLHKPVARVQKNALVLEDLLHETPDTHPDFQALKEAQNIMRTFLSEFNHIQTKDIYPSEDKSLRRLVRNSFIIELADGHRKLRHLFLFNDVIACAKYNKSLSRSVEYELKWFIPLKDIVIEDSSVETKESSPVNILQLKSQACTVRDQIMLEEKEDKKQKFNGSSRINDKHRKKLADLEAQLVLASPNLVFKIKNSSNGKVLTFFLSSDYEKSQWIEAIVSLKESCNLPGSNNVNNYNLQAWITACQSLMKTEMGSYLSLNSRDESLLVGDLHLTIKDLKTLDQPSDSYIYVEVDSYGHYFRKAKTKMICRNATPAWNESFVIELEGSQNVRILLYEDHPPSQQLKGKHILRLSRRWLSEQPINREISMSEGINLNVGLRFIPGEVTLRRVPTSKPGALFGAKIQQVLKREKRDTPFIISACIREVERRGMGEVGIYRVSGSASDLARLKKSFETNSYEAEQLLKDVDIHSVTGILKSYLRDLPEALFTDSYYQNFSDVFNQKNITNEMAKIHALHGVFEKLPTPNQKTINLILDHLIRVYQQEAENKMSLNNLAMVFGPTLLRPGPQAAKQKDLLASSTVDVMTQAGILHYFLQAKLHVN